MRGTDRGALILGAAAGASAWISLGALAVTSDRLTRVGVAAAALDARPRWCRGGAVADLARAAAATRDAWPLALTLLLWLPWLPVPIASALTIWEGPLEALVWLAAIGGVLVAARVVAGAAIAGVRRRDPTRAPLHRSPRWRSCASIATAVALAERIPGGDEPHYLIITQSLLKDGDLRIQNNHDRGDYFDYFDDGLPPDFLKRGLDGQIYSIHAPGVGAADPAGVLHRRISGQRGVHRAARRGRSGRELASRAASHGRRRLGVGRGAGRRSQRHRLPPQLFDLSRPGGLGRRLRGDSAFSCGSR